MTVCYLRFDDEFLESATRHATIRDACFVFMDAASELARYGQKSEASIHIATNTNEVAEYPDFVLSLGPRGGLRKEAA